MTQDQFYSVKVTVEHETDKGKIKKLTEQYLVNAVSVTDAEVKINEDFENYPNDWEVKSVVATKIIKVI
jgi:hypothetical protein|tara:strand:- start:658 stop:864 length:207 start_codon:yes stop_codon:yes gene_type:complete